MRILDRSPLSLQLLFIYPLVTTASPPPPDASNLDAVLSFLVHTVNNLVMRTRELVAGRHSRKTAAFVRSCVAFNFITIPSIAGPRLVSRNTLR